MSFDSAPGRWLLAVAVLGSGIAFLDATVVNVALPDIGRDLHASTSTLQWILNGYTLTLASLILLGGSLGDRYGRRRIFVAGTGLFTIASLLCAVAPNAGLLVVARLVQGVGGALLTPGSLAMVESGFRPADRARAIGAWSGLGAVAGALGPMVGGVLVAAVSWRAVFLINLPLGVFIVVMAGSHVPETHDPAAGGPLDFRGAILAAVGLGGTTYALIEAPALGGSPLVLVAAIGGGLALVAFVFAERRSANRMMPLSMFASRTGHGNGDGCRGRAALGHCLGDQHRGFSSLRPDHRRRAALGGRTHGVEVLRPGGNGPRLPHRDADLRWARGSGWGAGLVDDQLRSPRVRDRPARGPADRGTARLLVRRRRPPVKTRTRGGMPPHRRRLDGRVNFGMTERTQSEPAEGEAGGPVNTTRCAEVLSLSPASTAEPEDRSAVRASRPPSQVKVLLIAERVEGFFLERLTDRGELVGETQHDTLDEAMWQAYSEYTAISERRFCPDDADPLEYIQTYSRP